MPKTQNKRNGCISVRARETRIMNWRMCRLASAAGALASIASELKLLGFDPKSLFIASAEASDYLKELQTPEGKLRRWAAVNRAIALVTGEPNSMDKQIRMPF